MGPTGELARWVEGAAYEHLPAETVACAKGLLLKTLVAELLGGREPLGRSLLAMAAEAGGAPQATVVGGGLRAPVETAAFVNGVLAHATETEDAYFFPNREATASCWIFPALLTLAEMRGASGRELIIASVVAFELAARMGLAGPGLGTGSGINTATWFGVPAVAAGAARLLGLDAARIESAMSIGCAHSAGLAAQVGFDAHTIEAGHCGRAGVFSARLAAVGGTGAPGCLDDDRLLYGPLRGRGAIDAGILCRDLGAPPFAVHQLEIKKYPGCGFLHASVDLLARLVERGELRPDEVHSIETVVHPMAARICDRPAPATPAAARFSFQYVLAEVLLRGRVDWDSFSDPGRLGDPLVLATQKKVRVTADPRRSASDSGARLRVTTRDGRTRLEQAGAFRGHPLDPLDLEDLRGLLRPLLDREIGEEQGGRVEGMILHLDELPAASELMAPLERRREPSGRRNPAGPHAVARCERNGIGSRGRSIR